MRAVDPAGRARAVSESLGGLGETMGFTVQRVILEGRHNTPTDMIRAALGVSRGDPILEISPDRARERLESIAWVQRAHVERRLPSTLLVRIEERRPFAIWQHNGRFVIIDREGKVVAAGSGFRQGLDCAVEQPARKVLVVSRHDDRPLAGDGLRFAFDDVGHGANLARAG